jgi:hypothetical protein
MLVMRNFGYLGLHRVVDGQSSLARDRIVDFAGELQFRRKVDHELSKGKQKPKKDGCTTTLPEWKPEFIAEPVEEGGRYLDDSEESALPGKSIRYAQELLPIRLQLSPSLRLAPPAQQSGTRGRANGNDIEPYYHTCFCNEMLILPRMLHNCPKGNIVVKAELRELEWSEPLAAYVAHLPRCGPSFHNNRRGPFLVQSVLTSCSPRGSDKNFIDEFKIKLPLDLSPTVKSRSLRSFCLFFTVYNVRMSSKNKWKRAKKIFTGSDDLRSSDPSAVSSRAEQIASGFFPIARNGCLVDDGIHDVRIMYSAEEPPENLIASGVVDETSLVLREKIVVVEGKPGRDHSFAEETTGSNDSGANEISLSDSVATGSEFVHSTDDSRSERGRAPTEPISLSVRICANSSVHSQNPILSDYLQAEEDSQREVDLNKNGFLSKISMGRDLLLEASTTRSYSEDEEQLLRSTLEIVKNNVCPVTRSHGFLLRAMTRLWRTLIVGTGEPSLSWSNPATHVPLRLHAFASILQLLGGSSLFLTKNGLTQADGSKWSIVSLARVVALFFDEQELFGQSAAEIFDPNFLRRANPDDVSSEKRQPSSRRKRHVRNNFDLYDLQASPESASATSTGSTPTHTRWMSDIPSRPTDSLSSLDTPNDGSPFFKSQHKKELKIDSKSDFQSALRAASSAEDDFDRPESDGSRAAKAMIQAFGGPSSGNRNWMTAPTKGLTTIRESDDTDAEERTTPTTKDEATVTTQAESSSTSSVAKETMDEEMMLNRTKKSEFKSNTYDPFFDLSLEVSQ